MTRHKTISSLSVAATAIFFAAIPCFAQAQDDSNAATNAPAAINIQAAVAMNRDLAPKHVATAPKTDERIAASRSALSPARFEQSAEQFSAGAGERLIASSNSSFAPRVDTSQKQFNADDEGELAQRSRVTFVPSKGQKLPNN